MLKKFFQKYFTESFFVNFPLVANTIISLITLPIVLKSLPIVDYGKWQFVLALQTWLVCFSGANITYGAKRGIAKGLNGTFLYAFLKRFYLIFLLSLFVFGASIYFKIIEKNIFPALFVIVGIYLILGYLFQQSFNEFLVAKKRFKEFAFWQIFISSFSLIGSVIVAFYTKNVVYFALFQLGSISVLSFVLWGFLVKKENLILSYKRGEIDKACFSYGLKLIPVDLVSATSTKLSHFIIGPFFGFSNLAVFSVANKLRDKVASIIKSLRPLLYADFAKKRRKELIEIVNHYLVKIVTAGILLVLAFIGASWLYIKFFLPIAFHNAITYFIILSLGLPPGAMAIILHTILESHLRYKELTVVSAVSGLIRVALVLLFGYFWRIIGVCVALALGGWITFGFYYLLTIKTEIVIRFVHRHPWIEKLTEKY